MHRRQTGVEEKYFIRVDVTEEIPLLVKLAWSSNSAACQLIRCLASPRRRSHHSRCPTHPGRKVKVSVLEKGLVHSLYPRFEEFTSIILIGAASQLRDARVTP